MEFRNIDQCQRIVTNFTKVFSRKINEYIKCDESLIKCEVCPCGCRAGNRWGNYAYFALLLLPFLVTLYQLYPTPECPEPPPKPPCPAKAKQKKPCQARF